MGRLGHGLSTILADPIDTSNEVFQIVGQYPKWIANGIPHHRLGRRERLRKGQRSGAVLHEALREREVRSSPGARSQ